MSKRTREDILDDDRRKTASKIRRPNPESPHKSSVIIDLTNLDDSLDKRGSRAKNPTTIDQNNRSTSRNGENIPKTSRNSNKVCSKDIHEGLGVTDDAELQEILSQLAEEADFTADDVQKPAGTRAKPTTAIDENILAAEQLDFSDDEGVGSQTASIRANPTVSEALSQGRIDSGLADCQTNFLDGMDELFDEWGDENYDLDLSELRRVQVTAIDRGTRSLRLTVKDTASEEKALVTCSGFWLQSIISENDFMVVRAKKALGEWVVNNEGGLLITDPDTLVAGTSVVGGLFCPRKGILNERFRGIDCLPNMAATDGAMTCGSVTHELLQAALKHKIHSLNALQDKLEDMVKQPYIIQLLYTSNLKLKEFMDTMAEYVPRIHEFIERYIHGKVPPVHDTCFAGTIDCVKDVEESVWLPSLGIKGKIDVTVEAIVRNERQLMPLEIKTGRTSFANEHKGQLFLYCMMLGLLGYEVSSGLLLYIKDNVMQELKSTHNEQRDLIVLRNTVAYYMSREPSAEVDNDTPADQPTQWRLPELPEPVYNSRACSKCTYQTICMAYAARDDSLDLPESHPHAKLTKRLTNDLPAAHIDWVLNWVSLLQMESSYNHSTAANRTIWAQTPQSRERARLCVSFVKVDLPVVYHDDRYLHKFSRAPDAGALPVENFQEVFDVNDYVMVNTDTRLNLACGNVMEVTADAITLSLQRDLTRRHPNWVYHLDMFPVNTMTTRILGSVAALLADNDITRRIRRIVVDQRPATFTQMLPIGLQREDAKRVMQPLNEYQQQALKAVLQADDYVLIKGMPGTGKTQTLVALIEMLTLLGNSVLITAHTHMAVDNILMKLLAKDIDFVRLGSRFRINEELDHKTDARLIEECDSPEKLEALYAKKNVVAVTCLGANHFLMARRMFDYCVVDECTQALLPILLRPLYNARKFVLVGDPEQLPAVIRSPEARKLGMDEDMFSRLDSANNTRVLKLQYRMNKSIMNLANYLTYKGELLAGNEDIANGTLEWKYPEELENCEPWLRKVLSAEIKDAVIFLNTNATYSMNGNATGRKGGKNDEEESSRCSNIMEAIIILKIQKALINAGIEAKNIGVIAPFKAQIIMLRRILPEAVEINTVDQYQGRDKSVILFSCTRSVPSESTRKIIDYEILADFKRLNVAMTRAKHKLIIVGDKTSLTRFPPFQKLFNILTDEVVTLTQGCDGFSWQTIREMATGPRFQGLLF